MRKAFQQGHGDGLCGLYSLLNFLHRTRGYGWSNPTETLWYLFEAARTFGWLSPSNLTQGFEDYQLKKMLDLQLENYRTAYETYLLEDVVEALGTERFYDLAERVVEKKGSIIASWDDRDHWVLVTGEKGSPAVVDSAKSEGAIRSLSARQRASTLNNGLVILPKQRPVIEVDL